ncbi:NADPH:quinone reductase [Extensimonas sp. H3M7-6]|uniref:NADPH:quinone reductase n=1 Tax=Extensimonas soli TaxID=3031322 RepID=UPI0023DA6A88|nr:NADPH:quinone reductase [Extensimonas sp. H3M7-6]MDF1483556.1 NADPH:quinone reductase [Extensimonas sp. H3M7-6]
MLMNAASYDRIGAAREVLTVHKLEVPEPGPGEVRVKIALSAINPSDVKARSGFTPRPIDGFQVPHMDGAGQIDAVGVGVDPERLGQRVWLWLTAYRNRWGTAAEYCVVKADQAVPLPDQASDELGACLGIPAITAHLCLFPDGPVNGLDVLVAGGAGAVGHYGIELAKWAGARVVTTVSNDEKAELARQAGADLVVNYREADVVDRIKGFSRGIDRVVEVALLDNWDMDFAVVKAGAHIVSYTNDGRKLTVDLRQCLTTCISLRFLLLYTEPRQEMIEAARNLTAAMAGGALTPLPVNVFALDQIAEAHEAVEANVLGKVLIDMRD